MKNSKRIHEDFLNYLEGTLSEEQRAEFDAALSADEALREDFAHYLHVVELEAKMAEEKFEVDSTFVHKVMEAVEPQPKWWQQLSFEQLRNWLRSSRPLVARPLAAGLAGLAVCSLALGVYFSPEYRDAVSKARVVPSNEVTQLQALEAGESKQSAASQRRTEQMPLPSKRMRAPEGTSGLVVEDLGASSLTVDRQVGAPPQSYSEYASPLVESALSRGLIAPAPDLSVQALSRERYQELTEGRRILTRTDPLSTFSIDVDTGSYTNARRFLRLGQVPPRDSVRTEEFINYFDYEYPSKSEGPFATHLEIAPSPGGEGRYLLKIGIRAGDMSQSSIIKPWNLVFLVDVSGSMNEPNKLPLVQRSLELLVNQMRPGDRVSVVTYAGSSGVVLPPTEIKERSKILSAIGGLASGGGTHGAAGIQEAYRLAQEAFIEDGVNRVILATDGDFNVGITNTQELIRLIEEKRKSGVTLTTLGFGTGNYHEALIEQLANKGDGNYFYIDSFGEARKVFETDLWGTVQVVAKDVKLQVEFNPAQVLEHRLIGYENRALEHHQFSDDRVDAGEIGSGHRVTALYEVVLAGTEAAARVVPEFRYEQNRPSVEAAPSPGASDEVAFLKIRYKDPAGGSSRLLSFPVRRSEVKDRVEAASMNFRFAAAVAAFAQKLRKSPLAPELSFADIAELAGGALGSDANGLRREFVEFVRSQAALEGTQK